MTTAYPVSLRKKIITLYQKRNITISKVAKIFKISGTSVKRYLRQYREHGNLATERGRRGRQPKIDAIGLAIIKKIIQKHPTITLRKLSELYYKKRKIRVGIAVLSKVCLKSNLRRKRLNSTKITSLPPKIKITRRAQT